MHNNIFMLKIHLAISITSDGVMEWFIPLPFAVAWISKNPHLLVNHSKDSSASQG